MRRLHCWRAQEIAARMSLSSGRDSQVGTCSRSTDGFTCPTAAQSSVRGRIFGHGFPASGVGIHGPSADGASSPCTVGGWASAGPRAMGDVD